MMEANPNDSVGVSHPMPPNRTVRAAKRYGKTATVINRRVNRVVDRLRQSAEKENVPDLVCTSVLGCRYNVYESDGSRFPESLITQQTDYQRFYRYFTRRLVPEPNLILGVVNGQLSFGFRTHKFRFYWFLLTGMSIALHSKQWTKPVAAHEFISMSAKRVAESNEQSAAIKLVR